MKKFSRSLFATVIAAAIGLSTVFSVAAAQEGKIPFTTSSKKALDYFKQGKDLFDKLRFPDSKTYFEKAVAEDPNFAIAYLYLGFATPSAKGYFDNLEKAKQVMDKASEAERWWILGSEAGFVGDPETQHTLYSKMVANYPNDEQAHMLLGNYYFGQQQYDDAIKEYEAAKKANPNFSQIYNQLGYAYRFQEKYDDAEKAFKKYTELIPDDPNPYDSYAEFLMKVGRYEESIQQYRNALKYDPTFAASYTGIAANYNFMGKYDEARAAAQELFDNAVNDGQRRTAHFTKAVSYIDQGDLDNAIAEFEKEMIFAKKIDDAAAMSGDLVNIGNMKLEQGKPEQAMAHFTLAMDIVQKSNLSDELKKNNRLGYLYNEADAAIKSGDLAKAKANLDKYRTGAMENNNRFQIWASHQLAGMIALKEKDYKTAASELQQSNPQNMYNLYRLALAYEGMGDKENAKKTCGELVNYNQLNSINYGLVRHKAKEMMASM